MKKALYTPLVPWPLSGSKDDTSGSSLVWVPNPTCTFSVSPSPSSTIGAPVFTLVNSRNTEFCAPAYVGSLPNPISRW